MQNRTPLKSGLVSLLVMLVTACSSTPEKVATTPEQNQDTQVQTASQTPSSWQQAYGEKLDTEPNQLSPTTVTEPPQTPPKPVTDVWQRIRNGFTISDHETIHSDTKQQLKWFVKHPDYVARVVERARPYLFYIVEQLEARHMPTELALLPIVESGYKPYAYSHGRAAGLWQFIPGTGKLYGLKQNWWYDGRRDVIQSTRAALDYLEKLHNDFGDWQLALAAYNCGEGTVSRAIKRNRQLGRKTNFWSLDLPRETSAYVPKLMAVSHLIKHPEKYDLSLNPIDNEPYLAIVNIGSQMDLALAAKMADISTDDLYMLNPGFNRWATDPNGPYDLVIPNEKETQFKLALAELPASARVQWARHKIKNGESLGIIARHYKTTIAVIKQANNLHGNTIRAGHHLLIPVASGKQADYALTESQRVATLQSGNAGSKAKKTYHTVQNGDTWWDIARAHGVNINTLTKWNGKAPGDVLHPGQKLVIWSDQGSNKSKNSKVKTVYYTIKGGDSLWSIAHKFNVSVSQVREWNSLSDRSLIQPGQNLTLYVDVTQQYDHI